MFFFCFYSILGGQVVRTFLFGKNFFFLKNSLKKKEKGPENLNFKILT